MTHKFNVELAQIHGVYKALLLDHIYYHQTKNEGSKEYMFNKQSWATAKVRQMANIYPYISKSAIQRHLKELEESDIIATHDVIKNNINHIRYYRIKDNETMSHIGTSAESGLNLDNNQKSQSKENQSMSHIGTPRQDTEIKGKTPENRRLEQTEPTSHIGTPTSHIGTSTESLETQKNRQNRRLEETDRSPILGHHSIYTKVEYFSIKNFTVLDEQAERVRKILEGFPVPEFTLPLFENEKFPQEYINYWVVMFAKFKHWPDPVTVVKDYQRLIELTPDGSDADKIVVQTLHGKNKTFYPLKKDKPKPNKRERPKW